MIGTRDFRTWIAWRWYSKSIFDDLLECTSYTKQDLSKLRYGQKVSIVYGYDLKSQFDAMPGFSQVLVDWSKITSAHQAQEVVVKTFTEQLCLEYLKNRLAVGLTFVIPEALAKKICMVTFLHHRCPWLPYVTRSMIYHPAPVSCSVVTLSLVSLTRGQKRSS